MNIGFIGTGAMGGAFIQSISSTDSAKQYTLHAFDTDDRKLKELSGRLGVIPASNAESLTDVSDIIVLAVKPNFVESVLKQIQDHLTENKILVTFAVGLPISLYQRILGDSVKVVRTMPNTPALIGKGMTLYCVSAEVTPTEKEQVAKILSCAGLAEELDERLMSQVTALTGSSPAYVFMFIEAMADAAVLSGIPRHLAYRLASQAVSGSAELVLKTGKHPGELKDMVCSPAGTTIEAVAELEKNGFRHAVISAMNACTAKAIEIGKKYE